MSLGGKREVQSTDVSQVGVALFPSFQNIIYHFAFPDFPFILKYYKTYPKKFNIKDKHIQDRYKRKT